MIINKILDVLLEKYDIEEEDVDKVKKILDKVSYQKRRQECYADYHW